ncbi:hypothetical protein G7Z17_g1343 [Cylindrodendrum hubeiense]|uniref:tyrosinase n=1 Tax=Cylindrodendrum hubeiense TaxID=595255 RepID=A0A9P5LLI3_9HYPO|nr:hypothetical protein G7Z17_g1343 [Cylindrodendrum hubeiense]
MPNFDPKDPEGSYPIKGIALDNGEIPGIRQELRDFKKDTDMWNLYLLGLWQFQQVPMKGQLSYFQIAGIHGFPYQAWPLNDPNLEKLKKQQAGFCTHTSILFLTWHRPYLALFESVLQDAMLSVAEQFTEEEGQGRYLAAAKAFRMPFWDWARSDLPVFPDEATDSNVVRVVMPETLRKEDEGRKKEADGSVEIPNPLYSYKFQEGVGKDFKIEGLQTTTRYHSAGVSTEQSPEQQKEAILDEITPFTREVSRDLGVERNLRERVVYLIQSYEMFDQVSHNKWDPKNNGRGFGSIEDIHNAVHGLVGGFGSDRQNRSRTGHMSRVPISAFDPIFWLHHTNIDRIVSMWEGMRADPSKPECWVTTKKSLGGTWVTLGNSDEGLDTPLAPFYKDKDSFWNSREVRDTTTFGYAYPETKSWGFANPGDYREDIKQRLSALYASGSLATMITASKAGDKQPEATLRTRAKKLARIDAVDSPSTAITALSLAQAVSPTPESRLAAVLPPLDVPSIQVPDGRSLAQLAKGDTYLEWLVNIKAVKHTLDGQYLVHIFLGRVPPEESTVLYAVSPYHIGTFSPLGQSEETGCEKCQHDQAAATEITGQIPLTIALAERYFAGELDSLLKEDVIKYLQTNLHWEVVDKQGQRLESQRDLVEGLLVGVVSNEVTLPGNGSGFPRYSPDITVHPAITTKQDGTSGRAEGTGVTENNKYFH